LRTFQFFALNSGKRKTEKYCLRGEIEMSESSASSHFKPEASENNLKAEATGKDPKPEATVTPTNGGKGTSKRLTNGENQVALTDFKVEAITPDHEIALREKSLNEKNDDKFDGLEKTIIAGCDRIIARIDGLEKTMNAKFDGVNARFDRLEKSLEGVKSYIGGGLITFIAGVVGGLLLMYFKL
jgi:hypothetical protein